MTHLDLILEVINKTVLCMGPDWRLYNVEERYNDLSLAFQWTQSQGLPGGVVSSISFNLQELERSKLGIAHHISLHCEDAKARGKQVIQEFLASGGVK